LSHTIGRKLLTSQLSLYAGNFLKNWHVSEEVSCSDHRYIQFTITGRLLNKKDELLNSLTLNSPQIICISEHHLNIEELESMILHSYMLGG
jgi:hypothetical protein